jgi:hypothetical protein
VHRFASSDDWTEESTQRAKERFEKMTEAWGWCHCLGTGALPMIPHNVTGAQSRRPRTLDRAR